MTGTYTPEEIAILTKDHRLALEPSDNRSLSIPALDLLNREKCAPYLERVREVFEASTQTATASLFAKRYSFLIMASSLYAMSVFNKGLDYSIDNCHVESYYQGQAWLPRVRLAEWQVSQPVAGEREAWRERIVRSIFAGNLAPTWQFLAKSVPISKAVLWENTAIYVFWLYENKFIEGIGKADKERVREDYDYLVRVAPGELFGETKNPLARFDSPKQATRASEQPIRIRKTCCYYYQASDEPEDYCVTCPKIKHEAIAAGQPG
ncbi:IucA/IucC family C-terminal-domain containing protein [Cohnella boryungensis]|uniref:IucA/IucC family C-terminal-domain containing protein n=1 Tax=Cohnella boryungensis TaxID=768479 RepID=A0ABV8S6Q2_9BACL